MAFFNISSFFGNSSTNSFSSFNFADYEIGRAHV